MAVKDSLRLEAIYFQNLRSMIDTLKGWKASEEPGKIFDILDSCISANSAILLLYKNLGEAAADFAAQIKKTGEALDKFKTAVEIYKDELNEKIDDVNNYLNALISDLEGRVAALEQRDKIVRMFVYDETTEEPYFVIKDKRFMEKTPEYYAAHNYTFEEMKEIFISSYCVLIEPAQAWDDSFYIPKTNGIIDGDHLDALRWELSKLDEVYDVNAGDYHTKVLTINNYVYNSDGTIDKLFGGFDVSLFSDYYRTAVAGTGGHSIDATGDLNEATLGTVQVYNGAAHSPASYNGWVWTMGGATSKVQLFFSAGVGSSFYVRYYFNNAWTAWYIVRMMSA